MSICTLFATFFVTGESKPEEKGKKGEEKKLDVSVDISSPHAHNLGGGIRQRV